MSLVAWDSIREQSSPVQATTAVSVYFPIWDNQVFRVSSAVDRFKEDLNLASFMQACGPLT